MLHFPQWKVILVFGVVLAGIIFALPNLFARSTMESMPSWVPHHQVNLGLDLQGGAHLLYQLDENEMIEDWLNKLRDEVRETLRKDRISYTDLTQNVAARTVSVKIRQATDFDKGYQDLRKLAQPVGGSFGLSGANNLDVSQNGDDGIVLKVTDAGLTQRMNSAIQASIETIRRRVDAFGTTEPSIQRQGRNRVLVQVPGISDVERLKKLIGETGKLEFRMVDPGANAQQVVETKQVPLDDELLYSKDTPPVPYVIRKQVLVSGENLVELSAWLRSAHQRADRDLPLRLHRRQALRQGDAGERRPALRHHPRWQSGLGAGHSRADPRRFRPDQRPLHRA